MDILRKHTRINDSRTRSTDSIVLIQVFGDYIVQMMRKIDRPDTPLQLYTSGVFHEVSDAVDCYQGVNNNKIELTRVNLG